MSADRAVGPARSRRPVQRRPAQRRPVLRSVPRGTTRAPRAPFVVLVLLVLGVGLIGLLLLNTALQQGSFALDELEAETAQLRDRQTALAEDLAARSAPDAVASWAARMGMEPAEAPLFLELPGRSEAGGER